MFHLRVFGGVCNLNFSNLDQFAANIDNHLEAPIESIGDTYIMLVIDDRLTLQF